MSGQLLLPMLTLMGPQSECPAKTSSGDCTGQCSWTATRTPKCGMSQKTVDDSLAAMSDPVLKAIYGTTFKCSMVIGNDKSKCEADKDCKWEATESTNSTRRLLGSEDEEESQCGPSDMSTAVAMATHCPTQFDSMMEMAMKDPDATEADKKMMEEVKAQKDAGTLGGSTASAAARSYSAIAAAALATAAALLFAAA